MGRRVAVVVSDVWVCGVNQEHTLFFFFFWLSLVYFYFFFRFAKTCICRTLNFPE